MGSDDRKMEIILQGNEVSSLLKALAEAFRSPVLPEALKAFGPHLETCAKFEFSLKQLGGMAEFKVKAKGLPRQGEGAAHASRPASYKTVKKRLKTSYKYLQHSLGNLLLPPAEVMDAFLRDSLAMCEHPDRGGHDYGAHLQLCNELKNAFDRKDRAGMVAVITEIEAAKKTCHAAAK
jgi:XXXCH domain-containing protein